MILHNILSTQQSVFLFRFTRHTRITYVNNLNLYQTSSTGRSALNHKWRRWTVRSLERSFLRDSFRCLAACKWYWWAVLVFFGKDSAAGSMGMLMEQWWWRCDAVINWSSWRFSTWLQALLRLGWQIPRREHLAEPFQRILCILRKYHRWRGRWGHGQSVVMRILKQ